MEANSKINLVGKSIVSVADNLKKVFFFCLFVLCEPFLKSSLNLLQYRSVLCFGFLTSSHVGSWPPQTGIESTTSCIGR